MRDPIKPVALVTFAYLAVASFLSLQLRNWEFVFYIVVVLLLGLLVVTVHRRVHLSRGVLWALCAWGFLHMAGGLVPVPESWPVNGDKNVLYSLWLIPQYFKYDQALHAYGFGVATWVVWQGLRSIFPKARATAGTLMICALAGMGLGAFNEVLEFIAVLTLPDTNVGGYDNTGWDLVANTAGCVIAAVLIRQKNKA